eukprot:278622_1
MRMQSMSQLKQLLNTHYRKPQLQLFTKLFKYHSTANIHDYNQRNASCSFTVNSLSYCDGYDEPLYNKMKNDTNRTSFYQQCIAKYCENKIVLDIGCGSLALLSIMAAEANASKVYAIEVNKQAFNNAKQLIKDKGLSNKITIINGYSNEIELPEKCDIIIHEIIGEIASSEGVNNVIQSAKQKFIKTTNTNVCSIPDYVQTYLMPVEFPDIEYWKSLTEKIIENKQCNTINLWNFPSRHFLCSVHNIGLWEHIQFNKYGNNIDDQFMMNDYEFIAQKDGVLGGLLSSIEIGVDKDNILSSKPYSNNCMWANKLIMLDKKIEINKGDKIYVTAKSDVDDHVLKYDFSVRVETK